MSWIENVRKKPRDQKIKLIWIITCIAGLILIALWILIGKYQTNANKDTSLFKTIGKGIKDFKITPPDEITKPNN